MSNPTHRTANVDSIRRYSLHSLLQAACRVHQRGMELSLESEQQLRSAGLSSQFDLSDTTSATTSASRTPPPVREEGPGHGGRAGMLQRTPSSKNFR
ncbi:MAG: hypothetical protein RMK29_04990 [Myxococcales bacterium]|nr:hypothetical protein [Myxococcota bacterium]MDW8281046.1 hypothetical protein [Myxococcales bacterium]